jgi:hypothetical protein
MLFFVLLLIGTAFELETSNIFLQLLIAVISHLMTNLLHRFVIERQFTQPDSML